ncbi:hypothetical protein ACLOJK_005892 [Asimina triloba]
MQRLESYSTHRSCHRVTWRSRVRIVETTSCFTRTKIEGKASPPSLLEKTQFAYIPLVVSDSL